MADRSTDPVRIALVGLGRWANAHAAAASRSEAVSLIGCFTRNPERRDAFAADHAIAKAYSSFDSLLADDEIEAIVLSTPNDLHVEMTLSALAVGKAVLVDKPISVDLAEGLRLMRLPDTAPIVGVAHHARRLAGHRAARQWIDRGDAGEVRVAHATFSNSRGAEMATDAWQRHVKGAEAGVLIQVGIHQVDNVLYLLGPAQSVNARFEYGVLGPTIPTTAAVIIRHTGGAVSSVTSNWTTPSHYRLDLEATGGNLEFRLDHRQWTSAAVDDYGILELHAPGDERRVYPVTKGDPLRDQLDSLAASVREAIPLEPGVIDGLRAIAVVEAAIRSAAQHGASVDMSDLAARSGATREEVRQIMGAPTNR